MKIKIAKTVASLLLANVVLLAEDSTQLEDVQVVTTAGGYAQNIADAAATISVIDRKSVV